MVHTYMIPPCRTVGTYSVGKRKWLYLSIGGYLHRRDKVRSGRDGVRHRPKQQRQDAKHDHNGALQPCSGLGRQVSSVELW